MKIIKVSHGENYFNTSEYEHMLTNNLACVHEDTPSKGIANITQFQLFINADIGDLVFICHSNKSVDVIGLFIDRRPLYSLANSHDRKWIAREFQLLFRAKEPNNHKKNIGRWWSPGDNSTCTEVKESEYNLFEETLLKPVFDVSFDVLNKRRNEEVIKLEFNIEKVRDFQKLFENCFNNEIKMLSTINQLNIIEKKKLLYDYEKRGAIRSQPVVLLRKNLVDFLNSKPDDELTKTIIDEQKLKISQTFKKNVFHAWASTSRIVYPFIYEANKKQIKDLIVKEIERFQSDLELQLVTKFNFVDFDGAQNQGSTDLWFAIYNNSHRSQKFAKQLFLKLGKNVEYGLLSHYNPAINQTKKANDYNYKEVLHVFSNFKKQIIDDNADSQKHMIKMIELLEYKKQIILQGPPGTGKTKQAKEIAVELLKVASINDLSNNPQFKLIQFHPSYTYEDFVRGIIADSKGDKIEYKNVNKILGKLAKEAFDNPSLNYILIIDEINRANLSSVLGEIIYALEYRGEKVESMYEVDGNGELVLPSNLYIIGTMNTADRSVGHIDYAIRRRFAFVDVLPENLTAQLTDDFKGDLFDKVAELFKKEHLSPEFKAKDVQLGHSYFIQQYERDEFGNDIIDKPYDFKMRLNYEIVPILKEYLNDGVFNNEPETVDKIKEIEAYQFS